MALLVTSLRQATIRLVLFPLNHRSLLPTRNHIQALHEPLHALHLPGEAYFEGCSSSDGGPC